MTESDFAQSDMNQADSGRFYRPVDWAAFYAATLICLCVYCYTLAPTLSLEDSGELGVAGDYLGVPHPPGYPIWSTFSWIFARIFSFVSFRGQPNPAWAIGLVSALFGALAAGLGAMLLCRSSTDLLTALRRRSSEANSEAGDENVEAMQLGHQSRLSIQAICFVSGVGGSLLYAFSPGLWSQSVIIEVYALNAFILMAILLMSYQWLCRPTVKLLYMTGFMFGLGLTNYQVLLLAALTLVIVIMMRDLNLFREFMIVGIAFIVCIGIIQIAAQPPALNFERHTRNSLPLEAHDFGNIACIALFMALMAMLITKRTFGTIPATVLTVVAAVGLLWYLLGIDPPDPYPVPVGQKMEPYRWGVKLVVLIGCLGTIVALSLFQRRAWIAACIYVGIAITMAILLRKGVLHSLDHPTSWWFWAYVALNCVLLTVAYFCLPHGRVVALTILLTELGVAYYAYMPIVSEIRNPPMNWGHPLTWEGFKHAITRGQYEKIGWSSDDLFRLKFIDQIGFFLTDVRAQFTLLCAPLGFLPFTLYGWKCGRIRFRMIYVALSITVVAVALVILDKIIPSESASALISTLYKSLLFIVFCVALWGVSFFSLRLFEEYVGRIAGKIKSTLPEQIVSALILLVVLAVYGFYAYKLGGKLTDMELAKALSLTQKLGILLLIIGPPLLFVVQFVLSRTIPGYDVDLDDHSMKWLLATLTGLAVMGLFLVSLANLKGDLQDTFIQRVKFISSHAFYALWIAYGIALGLAYIDRLFRRWPAVGRSALCVAALVPLIPIHQNWTNDQLIMEWGGAEQNGHDFGWQFGNYQLRGSEAIIEELAPDEEPLPNPEFPRDMGPNAVFFGGTDPGRFVPTYMIYSAHVRPDVYLITQNALADHTYMNVMRDLYGDDIWIPSSRDNANAFSRYVNDVRSGRVLAHADLKIEHGRVSVHGVGGVMIINGYLARMIYDYNIFRHNLYVEESYVINWMYPYLIPHGLIMQIAPAAMKKLEPEMVQRDLEFWDWYVRRLTTNSKFTRDVVARKSFSKLRSAIAGVYVHRLQFNEAEIAFRDALMLYPASPEANFRYAGDVLMRRGEFGRAKNVMVKFLELDPNNYSVARFTNQVTTIENKRARVIELQRQLQAPTNDPSLALELMTLFLDLGQNRAATGVGDQLLAQAALPPHLAYKIGEIYQKRKMWPKMDEALRACLTLAKGRMPPENLLTIARMYAEASMIKQSSTFLDAYLQIRKDDYRARADFAAMLVSLGDREKALAELDTAIRIGGDVARRMVLQNPHFKALEHDARFRELMQRKRPKTPFTLPSQIPLLNPNS